jgi:hypothetical protein
MKMLVHLVGIAATAVGVLAGDHPAAAHHSAAMFDASKIVVINATLKELRWTNPHVNLLVLGAAQEGDPPTEWLLETTSPGRLLRLGWMRTSIQPGDRVRVEIHPLNDAQEHGGSIQKITSMETGKSFGTNLRELDKPDSEPSAE